MKKMVLAFIMLSFGSLYADKIDSLIGLEFGGGYVNVKTTNSNNSPATISEEAKTVGQFGLKLGAQNEDFRVFFSAKYAKDGNDFFTYVLKYEVEGDYLFNVSRNMNLFIGIHTGISSIKFDADEQEKRTASNSYYGANVGMNYHYSKSLDLELGARFSQMDLENTKNNIKYAFDESASGYLSFIFKY